MDLSISCRVDSAANGILNIVSARFLLIEMSYTDIELSLSFVLVSNTETLLLIASDSSTAVLHAYTNAVCGR